MQFLKIEKWKINFRLELLDKYFPEVKLKEVVEKSGFMAGLLSYRPQKKGIFGKYKISNWEIIEE